MAKHCMQCDIGLEGSKKENHFVVLDTICRADYRKRLRQKVVGYLCERCAYGITGKEPEEAPNNVITLGVHDVSAS